jgi:glycosyltransferase involved in cell wall biosynthesis
MKNKVFFSVIIPTYNRASFIKKTIDSVLGQSHANFELLVIDDGSTDNTQEIISSITDPRIQYIKKQNEERAVARNYGANIANGEFVNFLDSDDLLYPNHLETANDLIVKNNKVNIFHLGYDIKLPNGKIIKKVDNLNGDLSKLLIKGNVFSCNGVFLKKEIILSNPFNTDRKLSALEDWELWLRLAVKYEIINLNTITSTIVNHEDRSVLIKNAEALILRIELLQKYILINKEILNFYKNMNVFKASCNSYISLHLALSNRHKVKSFKYLVKGFLISPFYVFSSRRFYATIKHLIFVHK